jgi:hypothetical protein
MARGFLGGLTALGGLEKSEELVAGCKPERQTIVEAR